MFTKEHYQVIARALRNAREQWPAGRDDNPQDWRDVAANLAIDTVEEQLLEAFAQDNPRFRAESFTWASHPATAVLPDPDAVF